MNLILYLSEKSVKILVRFCSTAAALPQKCFLFYLCSCRAVQAFCRPPLFVNFFKIILNCPCILGAGGILLSGVNS